MQIFLETYVLPHVLAFPSHANSVSGHHIWQSLKFKKSFKNSVYCISMKIKKTKTKQNRAIAIQWCHSSVCACLLRMLFRMLTWCIVYFHIMVWHTCWRFCSCVCVAEIFCQTVFCGQDIHRVEITLQKYFWYWIIIRSDSHYQVQMTQFVCFFPLTCHRLDSEHEHASKKKSTWIWMIGIRPPSYMEKSCTLFHYYHCCNARALTRARFCLLRLKG